MKRIADVTAAHIAMRSDLWWNCAHVCNDELDDATAVAAMSNNSPAMTRLPTTKPAPM